MVALAGMAVFALTLFGLYHMNKTGFEKTPTRSGKLLYDPRPAVVQVRAPEYNRGFGVATKAFEIYNGKEMIVDVRNAGDWLASRSPELLKAQQADYPKNEELKSLNPKTYFDPQTEEVDYKELKTLLDTVANPSPDLPDKIHTLLNRSRTRRVLEPLIVKCLGDARLALNGVVLDDLKPMEVNPAWEQWVEMVDNGVKSYGCNRYHFLRFKVDINDQNKPAWKTLLCDLGLGNKPLAVSLAFPNLTSSNPTEIMSTEVVPNAPELWHHAVLHVQRECTQIVLAIIFLLLFVLFTYGAVSTTLLRTLGKEDDLWHFSLGLCQMAWWFFIISTCYAFLWIALGDYKTFTTQELLLLGITAASGFGAFLVDDEKDSPGSPARVNSGLTNEQLRSRSVTELKKWLKEANDKNNPAMLAELKKRIEYYNVTNKVALQRFWNDLISEDNKGDPNFHRFQLIGWTAVFGFIFVQTVWHKLDMPAFSAEQLVLIGISNGTYLGFKWKDSQTSKPDAAPNPNG